MSKNRFAFDPAFHRDLRFIPARGKNFFPDFGITETFTRLAGKQPTTQIIGQGLGAKTYDIDPEANQDLLNQATLYNSGGDYIGGTLPSSSGVIIADNKKEEKKDPGLDLDTGSPISDDLKKTDKYKDFALDFIERGLVRGQNERSALRLGQGLIDQQTAALSERNRMALANQLAYSKFDTSAIARNRLRAQQGEAAMMNAIANQTTSSAQVGGLGTSRRYGR